jgi:hypothetical protein
MKKRRYERQFLEALGRMPIISSACKEVGISRNTVYRWKDEDPEFAVKLDKAIKMGIKSVNDVCEWGIVKKAQEGDFKAIKYWLDNNKKNYARPRPINFWNTAPPEQKIGGFRIHIVESKEDAEKYNKIIEFEKKYGDKAEREDDPFLLNDY